MRFWNFTGPILAGYFIAHMLFPQVDRGMKRLGQIIILVCVSTYRSIRWRARDFRIYHQKESRELRRMIEGQQEETRRRRQAQKLLVSK